MCAYKPLFEHFEKILSYRGHNVYDTEHSVDRYKERVGRDIFLYEKLLKKSINWIIDNHKESMEDRYIFCSKRYGFGIQIHWRQDRIYKGTFNGYSATTLSDNEMKVFLNNDKQIFVEQIKESFSNIDAEKFANIHYYRFQFDKILEKEMSMCGFDWFMEEGEVYRNFELIVL